MGGTNDLVQRGIGGAQIVGGAVASYFGMPEVGVPMMISGIKSEADPNAQQSPLDSGLQGALSTGGAVAGGYGGGIGGDASSLGGSGDISDLMNMVGGTGGGAGLDQMPIGMTSNGGIAATGGGMSGMTNFGMPQISQLLGGTQQAAQQAQNKPPTPPPPMAQRPPMPPATNLQSIGQQAATPQPRPAPPVPQMAQPPQNPQSIQALIAKLLGGS